MILSLKIVVLFQQNIDVASIVSQRLSAMRKLQENPNDVQALTSMYKAQKEVSISLFYFIFIYFFLLFYLFFIITLT